MGDTFKTGSGDAFEGLSRSGASRRKRSTRPIPWTNELIKLISESSARVKRETESFTEQMPVLNIPKPGTDSTFDKMKAAFSRIMDAAKDMFEKIKKSMGNAVQKTPTDNETFQ